MNLSLIVAVADDNVIGQNNTLPWHLPEDLKFFKKHTMGKPVLMGRKTFESLGRALPGRLNIVLSGSADLKLPEGVLLFNDIQAALKRIEQEQVEEAFVIGGGHLFETCLPYIDRMYITRVHGSFPVGDAFFPSIDHAHWKLIWEENHEADQEHMYPFTFQLFERLEL